MIERIAILGSTGSIGTSTLEVVGRHQEEFEIVALAAGNNVKRMVQQVKEFRPKLVSMGSKEAAELVREQIPPEVSVVWGKEGLLEVAQHPDATYVVSSLVGSVGLAPTLAAIEAGKKIGLANKETLVTAGHLVTAAAEKYQVPILPIDSEHSALFQCLNGERREDVRKIIITASGGSFRDKSRDQLVGVTKEEALNHPNWSMGPKVTIDSATLMNKGLEVIEAHWLYDISYQEIEVLIHPQSIIHSMVEFRDGAVMAQLGTPDMKVPIQYALSYPKRLPLETEVLNFAKLARLDFRAPDLIRFPCLRLAYEAGIAGGTMTTVLNAANEVAVEKFLQDQIPFLQIEEIVEESLSHHERIGDPNLEEIVWADQWARKFASSFNT